MSKRFIDSKLWGKDWFLDLPSKYKVFWFYMISNCDTAGIFDPNLKTISKMLNEKYLEDECLEVFKGKIVKVKDKWFVSKFIEFQYGLEISDKMIIPINKCLASIGYSIDTVSILYDVLPNQLDTPIYIEKEKDNKGGVGEKEKHYEFVYLKPEEYEKLVKQYGKERIDIQISNLNNYIGSSGKKYKSHYHTLLTWINKKGLPEAKKKENPRIEDPLKIMKSWEKELNEFNNNTR